MPSPREATSSSAARAKCRSSRTRNSACGSGRWRRCSYMRRHSPLSSRQTREAIRAPVFAPPTVVYEEQTVRIVLRLDGLQARVVLAPESAAPLRIEIVALRDVGAGARGDPAQFRGRPIDGARILMGGQQILGGAHQSRIARSSPSAMMASAKASVTAGLVAVSSA